MEKYKMESGCFCKDKMELILFVDATRRMVKRTNEGKTIILFLKNLMRRINFITTKVTIFFYGHNQLVRESKIMKADFLKTTNIFLDKVDFTKFVNYRREQPMIAIRRALKTEIKIDSGNVHYLYRKIKINFFVQVFKFMNKIKL
jgi:hypothetical protein